MRGLPQETAGQGPDLSSTCNRTWWLLHRNAQADGWPGLTGWPARTDREIEATMKEPEKTLASQRTQRNRSRRRPGGGGRNGPRVSARAQAGATQLAGLSLTMGTSGGPAAICARTCSSQGWEAFSWERGSRPRGPLNWGRGGGAGAIGAKALEPASPSEGD